MLRTETASYDHDMAGRHHALFAEHLEARRLLAAEVIPLHTFGVVERTQVVSVGEATAAALQDFNGDGIRDVAFGSSHRRGFLSDDLAVVGIALADGHGGFHLGTEQPVHDDVITLIAADLNGDGFSDLVAGGIFRLSVFLSEIGEEGEWLGLGSPKYIGGASENVVVEDFNGDGTLDIATSSIDQWIDNNLFEPYHPTYAERDITGVHVYSGDGAGTFLKVARHEGTEHLLPIDVDDDGDTDLITTVPGPPYATPNLRRLQSGALSDRAYRVLLNDSGSDIDFIEAPERLDWLEFNALHPTATYDIDGDAYPDELKTVYGDDLGNCYRHDETVFKLGRPGGGLAKPIHLAPIYSGGYREFGLGVSLPSAAPQFVLDIDGNGATDFVHVQGNSLLSVRQGRLEGYSGAAINYPSNVASYYHTRLVDITGDGSIDLVANHKYIQEGNPDGSFDAPYAVAEEQLDSMYEAQGILRYRGSRDPLPVDVDGDGVLELVGPRFGTLFLLGAEDVDQDGDMDLLLYDTSRHNRDQDRKRYVMYGDGEGAFSQAEVFVGIHIPTTHHTTGSVGVAVHEDSDLFYNWYVPQKVRFQIPVDNDSADVTCGPKHSARQVDVDGDGDLDVVVAHGGGVAVVLAVGPGDLDKDGQLTVTDLEILREARRDGTVDPNVFGDFDLNDDGTISTQDEDYWLTELARTHAGDIDLDGDVDFKDFLIIAANFDRQDATLAEGDVDGDRRVTFEDFLQLQLNFGRRS